MTGKEIRLQRLFNGNLDSGRIIVSAIDHGMFQGVQAGLENLSAVMSASRKADAILMGPGMIEHYGEHFRHRGGPLLISRLGFTSSYCFPWNYHEGHTRSMFSPSYLQSLGADAIVSSLQLKTGSESIDAENAEVWGRIVEEKERLGIPLVGEFHPVEYENVPKDEWHELIATGCRILCELGADCIKTFYTDERFTKIAESVPIPVLVLGSKKLPHEIDALRLAESAVAHGARGVAFGRNIFMARDPGRMIDALGAVVRDGRTADEAARVLGKDRP
jgi:DhnA family fructose-bisphosphate aldolase class Ia